MVEKSHTAGWWPNVYEPLRSIGERIADWFAPRSDASSAKDHYEINVELPGVDANDVEISMDGNQLTIRGEKRFEREEKGRTYFFTEREYGAFERSFRLPADADESRIDAQLINGVLQVRVVKRESVPPSGRKIEIRKS